MYYQPNLLIQALSGFLVEKKSGKGCVTCSKTWSTQKTGDVSHRSMHRQQTFLLLWRHQPFISQPSALTLQTAGANFIHNPIDPLLPPCYSGTEDQQLSAPPAPRTCATCHIQISSSGSFRSFYAFYGLHIA